MRVGQAAPIDLLVNGCSHMCSVDPATMLLYVLRNDIGLRGPKYGCGLGQCGACAVLIDDMAVRSCVTPISRMAGRRIETLEGLGSIQNMHVVQQAFVAKNAAQCGYCLNGMIIASVALLRKNAAPSDHQIRDALRHHLCRCGAHIEILAAVHDAIEAMDRGAPGNKGSSHE